MKPHGALYNRIVRDEVQAAAVVDAIRCVDPSLGVLTQPGTSLVINKQNGSIIFIKTNIRFGHPLLLSRVSGTSEIDQTRCIALKA